MKKAMPNSSLEMGNKKSSVAICTLWTQNEKIKVPGEMFAVKGNLYSGSGIRYLARSLLANPGIRYLVLCGNDRTGSGEDLVSMFRYGIEKNGKIIRSKTILDPGLTVELVNKIRKNVELIDMRGKEREIENRIKALGEKKPYSKPIIIEQPEEKKSELQIRDVSGFRVTGPDIAHTWLNILDVVMKFGEEKPSEHGMGQKEFLNIMAVIEGDDRIMQLWLPFNKGDLSNYYRTFFGRGSASGLSYTYGRRLFEYVTPGSEKKWEKEARVTFDQIRNAVKHLKKAPYTRRAVAFTWYVHEDSRSASPPCLTQITWSIKYGRLFQTAVFRSHDMFGGWPMNAFALRELQRRMAKELRIRPGPLTIISNSAHIYENNFGQASEIIREYHSGKYFPYIEDKLGYFTVSVRKGEVRAQHHMPDGRETGFIFSGKSAEEIRRRIMNENLVSDLSHAGYLGQELARAEYALKSGKRYVQS